MTGLDNRIKLIDSKVKEIENILQYNTKIENFDDKKYHSLVFKINEIEKQIKKLDGIRNAEKDASRKSQLKPAKESKTVSSSKSVEAESFNFILNRCSQSGSSVTCYMTFTNTGDDRELELMRRSRVFDNYGNEYRANQVCIANESKRYDVTKTFIKGVPTEAYLTFEDVSLQASHIAVLDVLLKLRNRFHIKFRDIKIDK